MRNRIRGNCQASKRAYYCHRGGLLHRWDRGKRTDPDSVVIIEGSSIKAVGRLHPVAYPSRANIIEAKNKTVLPGLIDMHGHYFEWMDHLFISHGVTTVRDVGNPLYHILQQGNGAMRKE